MDIVSNILVQCHWKVILNTTHWSNLDIPNLQIVELPDSFNYIQSRSISSIDWLIDWFDSRCFMHSCWLSSKHSIWWFTNKVMLLDCIIHHQPVIQIWVLQTLFHFMIIIIFNAYYAVFCYQSIMLESK